MKRKPPTLRQIAAAAVAQIIGIPREHLKQMTVDQVLSLINADHDPVPVAVAIKLGWTPERYNHPSNITIRAILNHREKTATVDVPAIYKSARVEEEHAAFQKRMLAKTSVDAAPEATERRKARIPSRPFSKEPRPFNRRKETS